MYIIIAIIIFCIIMLVLAALYYRFKSRINFIITGLDEGFSLADIHTLWETAELCGLEHPNSLYYSQPALNKCMSQLQNEDKEDNTDKNQKILGKLYNYRTKIENESDEKKGLATTLGLDKGQKIRIILPGKGVFASEVVNNGNQLVIDIPKQKEMITVSAEDWVNRHISVYLWRKGDARYVFDTFVTQCGMFLGRSSLFIQHSNNLLRTQKRKAVRANCEINADLFIVKDKNIDYSAIETKDGYRCLLKDISECGALIKIGGKGIENILIKIQFSIKNTLIVMFGVVRKVDYIEEEQVSLLHFECTHIEQQMRNEVLAYVYQLLPAEEKDIIDAISQTDEDSPEDLENESKKDDQENKTVEENAVANLYDELLLENMKSIDEKVKNAQLKK